MVCFNIKYVIATRGYDFFNNEINELLSYSTETAVRVG